MPSAGRVHYIEALPAPAAKRRGTLVLLHAFPLNARMWEPQLALAEAGWHVLAPQARGFDGGGDAGLRDSRPAASMDDYLGDLIDLLDALHVEDAVVGGLSMGGYLAFALLRRAPDYVRALILADTKPQADTPEALEGRRKLLDLVHKSGVPALVDEMAPKLVGETTRRTRPDVVQRVRAMAESSSADAVVGAIRVLMSRADSTPLLGSIRVPTLIVVGEEDTITPPSLSEEMHAKIAGSQLSRIAGAGHLSSLEQPEAFNAAVAPFLEHRV